MRVLYLVSLERIILERAMVYALLFLGVLLSFSNGFELAKPAVRYDMSLGAKKKALSVEEKINKLNQQISGLKNEVNTIKNKSIASSTKGSPKGGFDAASMATVKKDISNIKRLLEEERKQKKLDRAMQLTFLESFEYYDPNQRFSDKESSDLAKKAIGWFMLGFGFTLPSDAYLKRDRNGNTSMLVTRPGKHFGSYL